MSSELLERLGSMRIFRFSIWVSWLCSIYRLEHVMSRRRSLIARLLDHILGLWAICYAERDGFFINRTDEDYRDELYIFEHLWIYLVQESVVWWHTLVYCTQIFRICLCERVLLLVTHTFLELEMVLARKGVTKVLWVPPQWGYMRGFGIHEGISLASLNHFLLKVFNSLLYGVMGHAKSQLSHNSSSNCWMLFFGCRLVLRLC